MKVALIGASGFVGSAILEELLRRGHTVTAITRHPDRVKKDPNVIPVKADVLDEDQVAQAVKGHDVVVNAFNPGWTNPKINEEFIKGNTAVQNGALRSGIKRLFVMGGGGSLYVAPDKQLVDTPEFPTEYRPGALALRDYLEMIREEGRLDWTFLSPAIEMNPGTSGVRKGTYRTGLENPVFDDTGRSSISVEDMAIAIVDELERPRHSRERFTVGY